jgi:hypothetical protein
MKAAPPGGGGNRLGKRCKLSRKLTRFASFRATSPHPSSPLFRERQKIKITPAAYGSFNNFSTFSANPSRALISRRIPFLSTSQRAGIASMPFFTAGSV